MPRNPSSSPEEQTPETGEEGPRLSSPLPSWKAPTPEPVTELPPGSLASGPSPATGWDGGSDADAGSPEMSDEQLEQPRPRSGSSRTSSRAGKRRLREALERVIEGATAFAHQRLTDPAGEAAGLYLADPDDVSDIATPGAEIIHRRMPDIPLSDDADDVLALGLAVAAYIGKQINRWAVARQMRAQEYDTGAPPGEEPYGDGDPSAHSLTRVDAADLEEDGSVAAPPPQPVATMRPDLPGRPNLSGL